MSLLGSLTSTNSANEVDASISANQASITVVDVLYGPDSDMASLTIPNPIALVTSSFQVGPGKLVLAPSPSIDEGADYWTLTNSSFSIKPGGAFETVASTNGGSLRVCRFTTVPD
jgi:hypothetical protein